MTDRAQLHHLADRARRGVLLPAEGALLADAVTELEKRAACHERVAQSAARDAATALTAQLTAEAAIERVLSPAGIRAAAEAIGDEALTHLGRDLGTIHVDHIAEAGLRAALDQPQPPTA